MGKRKAGEGSRHEPSRKKARRETDLQLNIPEILEEDVIPKKGTKKTADLSPILEVEKVPKKL